MLDNYDFDPKDGVYRLRRMPNFVRVSYSYLASLIDTYNSQHTEESERPESPASANTVESFVTAFEDNVTPAEFLAANPCKVQGRLVDAGDNFTGLAPSPSTLEPRMVDDNLSGGAFEELMDTSLLNSFTSSRRNSDDSENGENELTITSATEGPLAPGNSPTRQTGGMGPQHPRTPHTVATNRGILFHPNPLFSNPVFPHPQTPSPGNKGTRTGSGAVNESADNGMFSPTFSHSQGHNQDRNPRISSTILGSPVSSQSEEKDDDDVFGPGPTISNRNTQQPAKRPPGPAASNNTTGKGSQRVRFVEPDHPRRRSTPRGRSSSSSSRKSPFGSGTTLAFDVAEGLKILRDVPRNVLRRCSKGGKEDRTENARRGHRRSSVAGGRGSGEWYGVVFGRDGEHQGEAGAGNTVSESGCDVDGGAEGGRGSKTGSCRQRVSNMCRSLGSSSCASSSLDWLGEFFRGNKKDSETGATADAADAGAGPGDAASAFTNISTSSQEAIRETRPHRLSGFTRRFNSTAASSSSEEESRPTRARRLSVFFTRRSNPPLPSKSTSPSLILSSALVRRNIQKCGDGELTESPATPGSFRWTHCAYCNNFINDVNKLLVLHCCRTVMHIECYCNVSPGNVQGSEGAERLTRDGQGLDNIPGAFICPSCGEHPVTSYGRDDIAEELRLLIEEEH